MIAWISIFVWLAIGIYGAVSNYERIPRVYPNVEREPLDWIQHLITVPLGPIGLIFVLMEGGRTRFWRKP